MNKTIFETLEHTIQEAIVKIDSLKNRNKILLEEKKQLQNQLAERDRRIKGCKKLFWILRKIQTRTRSNSTRKRKIN